MDKVLNFYGVVCLIAFIWGFIWQDMDNRNLPPTYYQSRLFSASLFALFWPLLAFSWLLFGRE